MNSSESIDGRLLAVLECPRDHSALQLDGGHLCCASGHRYPIVEGIPIFVLAEKEQTIGIAAASLRVAYQTTAGPLYLDTLGLSEDEKRGIDRDWKAGGSPVDPVISYLVGATSGYGYVNLIGRLADYPIPEIPLGNGSGDLLLDVGSNWGRWSVSAARKGWRAVAIDPSFGALVAAKRAFSGEGLDISFVCGDARHMPFKANAFGAAFSYSVLQHFSEQDTELALMEIRRILRSGGLAKIQMAHSGGLRGFYIRTRRDYARGGIFRVRYWSLVDMRAAFERCIGPSQLLAEAFGGLGLLAEDRKFVSAKAKLLILVSDLLRKLANVAPPLIRLADSVYVVATKG